MQIFLSTFMMGCRTVVLEDSLKHVAWSTMSAWMHCMVVFASESSLMLDGNNCSENQIKLYVSCLGRIFQFLPDGSARYISI